MTPTAKTSTTNRLLFGIAAWSAIAPVRHGAAPAPAVFFEDTALCVQEAYFDLGPEVSDLLRTAYFDKTEPDALDISALGGAVWRTLTDPAENVEVEIDPAALTVTVNGVVLHLTPARLAASALHELAAERARAFRDALVPDED